MLHGLCKVRKGYMLFNFVSHKPRFSRTVIRRQEIIFCFHPVEIHSWRPQLFKDYGEVQTVVPRWPTAQNTVFCQQRIENLAPR